MARKPRIYEPCGYYHVIVRGNDRQQIFFDKEDREYYEGLVAEGVKRFRYKVHAYCLMSNHVHLLIQITDVSLSKIMQNISFRYTRYINKKLSRVGHLFQGRYKAILIDADNYLLELVRYIHLNPVRAKMVEKAEEYIWSGHLVYIGKAKKEFLTTKDVLGQFSNKEKRARSEYKKFVKEGMGMEENNYQEKIKEGRILGNDRFIEKVLKESEERSNQRLEMENIIDKVCKYYEVKFEEIKRSGKNRRLSRIRNIVGYIVKEYSNSSMKEYSQEVLRDITSISKGIRKIEKEISENKELKREIMQLIPICQA